nr:LuxR C-terminal-related transcriptional regulator [Pseudoalteromonas shioyasakiensis]
MGGLWFDRLTMSKKIKNNSNDSTYLNFSNPVLTTSLTKREFEIAELVVIGLSNREIAQKKCISETTVKSHLKNILAKADVKNRTALVNKLRFQ